MGAEHDVPACGKRVAWSVPLAGTATPGPVLLGANGAGRAMTTSEASSLEPGRHAFGRRRQPRPVVGMLQQDLLEIHNEQWLGAIDAAGTSGCDLICFCGRPLEDQGFGRQA